MLKGKKIGFIGVGNMGSAIAGGLISSDAVNPDDIYVTDKDIKRASDFAKCGANVLPDAKAIASVCDIVIIAVKPQVYDYVLEDLKGYNKPVFISIAAGITIKYIKSFLGRDVKVVRVMPNTPALIGEGMTAVSTESPVTEEDEKTVCEIFESIGLAERVSEKLMDAVVSVSGSSPAYVYMMIEAMADAAVADGLPRNLAYTLAAQAVCGSAKMVLETKQHPGKLKDNVCSPGGTTIAAVKKLEEKAFRSAIIDAMAECTKKSKELTK